MFYLSDDPRERRDYLIASCQDRMLADAGDVAPCCCDCASTFVVAYRDESGVLTESIDLWCDEHGWLVSPDAPACERHRGS